VLKPASHLQWAAGEGDGMVAHLNKSHPQIADGGRQRILLVNSRSKANLAMRSVIGIQI
jgi:hypothetical protein